MRSVSMTLLCAAALVGCGNTAKINHNESTGSDDNTFFVPRNAVQSLPSHFRIVDHHDSGFLVRADEATESSDGLIPDGGFRMSDMSAGFKQLTFPTMEKKVQELAKTYSAYATLDTYATSTQGRPHYVLSLTNKAVTTPKTELLITAATHGNETATVDTVLGLTELLLQGQKSDARLKKMLDDHIVHVVPAVCVDSYVARQRHADGRDPNRDYPYPGQADRKPVKCIADIIAFFDAHDIVGTLDYHNSASMVFFPWAYTLNPIPQPDYDRLDNLTTEMAAENGFAHGQISTTIYVAKGSSADYYYWKRHAVATAIELSHNLVKNAKRADDLVREVTHSTWSFIEGAHW